jgi:hypothetical protein
MKFASRTSQLKTPGQCCPARLATEIVELNLLRLLRHSLGNQDFLKRLKRLDRFERLVHRLISRRHTAVGDLADFQGASDEHT